MDTTSVDLQKVLFGNIEAIGLGAILGAFSLFFPDTVVRFVLHSTTETYEASVFARLFGISLLVTSGLIYIIFKQADPAIRKHVLYVLAVGDFLQICWSIYLFVAYDMPVIPFLLVVLTALAFLVARTYFLFFVPQQHEGEQYEQVQELSDGGATVVTEETLSPEVENAMTSLMKEEENKFWQEQQQLLEQANETIINVEEPAEPTPEVRQRKDPERERRPSVRSALNKYLIDMNIQTKKEETDSAEPSPRNSPRPLDSPRKTDSPRKIDSPRLNDSPRTHQRVSTQTMLNQFLQEKGIKLPTEKKEETRPRRGSAFQKQKLKQEEDEFWKKQQEMLGDE